MTESVTKRTTHGFTCAVTPGVIDDDADILYKNGQCHALAMAFQHLTDWEIYAVPGWDGFPNHFVCHNPTNDTYGDITGFVDEQAIYEAWEVKYLEPICPDDIKDWVDRGEYQKMDMDLAVTFAKAILLMEGIEI